MQFFLKQGDSEAWSMSVNHTDTGKHTVPSDCRAWMDMLATKWSLDVTGAGFSRTPVGSCPRSPSHTWGQPLSVQRRFCFLFVAWIMWSPDQVQFCFWFWLVSICPPCLFSASLDVQAVDTCSEGQRKGFPGGPVFMNLPPETKIEKDTCAPMLVKALFPTARTWEQPGYPSTDEWIKKLWYTDTTDYHLAVKKESIWVSANDMDEARSYYWRRRWQPTPLSLPGEPQVQGSLVGCLPSVGSHRVGHDWTDLAAAADPITQSEVS